VDPKTKEPNWLRGQGTPVGAVIFEVTLGNISKIPFPVPQAFCCFEATAVSKEVHGQVPIQAWMYDERSGNCTIFEMLTAFNTSAKVPQITAGKVPKDNTPISPSMFYDLCVAIPAVVPAEMFLRLIPLLTLL